MSASVNQLGAIPLGRKRKMSKAKEVLKRLGEEEGKNDVKSLVRALIDTKDSSENADQGKFVQLLKGMSFSEDSKSDEFMKKLMKMVNDENFGEFL